MLSIDQGGEGPCDGCLQTQSYEGLTQVIVSFKSSIVPKLILELDPTYKLYIRHYSNALVETVCYAL